MTVNSYEFLFFFLLVFAGYYIPVVATDKRRQNAWLLMASGVFYGLTDWRMLVLLVAAIAAFFACGHVIGLALRKNKEKKARAWTFLGVIAGMAILVFFKYLDFFAQSMADFLNGIGCNVSWTALNIVIPVGVSFFTFKLIAYVVEIHRQRIKPADNFVDFAAYISFFPTILSGPIDTPNKFLPQLQKPRRFNEELATDGCRQILWGVLLKMVVADRLAYVTDTAWDTMEYQSASTLLVIALLFPIQIYVDFASYSDMAIGVGKILGFRVERNFNHPLLARNVAEYWRRWHMSLTNWITNYIFMPLNIHFRNLGKWGTILAVIINLVVIGLWHGANWTYALFGLYHGLLFIPLVFGGSFGKNKKIKPYELNCFHVRLTLPILKDLMWMTVTFCLVALGLVLFRAPDLQTAGQFVAAISKVSMTSIPDVPLGTVSYALIALVIVCEWTCRKDEHPLQTLRRKFENQRWVRIFIYYLILFVIFKYQAPNHDFIYFQF